MAHIQKETLPSSTKQALAAINIHPHKTLKTKKEKKKKLVFAGKEEDAYPAYKHPYHRKTHAFSWSNFSYSSMGETETWKTTERNLQLDRRIPAAGKASLW